MGFKFIRPDHNVLYGGTATGTVATGFDADWLVDGIVNQPAKGTSGTVSWAATGPATGTINAVVVANHNIDAARTISITGDISATLAGPAARTNGIPVNPWGTVTEVTGDEVTVGVTSNSVDVVIGELIAGDLTELTAGIRVTSAVIPRTNSIEHTTEGGTIRSYDRGYISRVLIGSIGCLKSDYDALVAFWEATRGNTRPAVIIPFDDVQDAWVVRFVSFDASVRYYISNTNAQYICRVVFEEYPRYRW